MPAESKPIGSALQLFEAALLVPDGPVRQSYLSEACADDQTLFQEIQELLNIDSSADELIVNRAASGNTKAIDRSVMLDLHSDEVSTRSSQSICDDTDRRTPSDNGLRATFHSPLAGEHPYVKAPETIGPYELLERIGEGGMGLVYLAQQTQPVRRQVAIKIIKPGMDSQQVIARFEAERQALAMMEHPNIAKVLDAGTTGTGLPYFVMELVRGIPITEYCDRSRLTIVQRLKLFLDACAAIQHSHNKGIIHRDIKPSNVLVTEHDRAPVVKVIDFGIAKAVDPESLDLLELTHGNQRLGTPLYMSPEQFSAGTATADTRSDIYSLGILLYELTTCHRPFDSDRLKSLPLEELQRVLREEQPNPPSDCLKKSRKIATGPYSSAANQPGLQCRREWDWVVMKTIEKSPDRRYQSVAELQGDIQRYLDHQPVAAHPVSLWYQSTKFVHRHRWATLVGSTVMTLIGVLICLLIVERQKLITEKQRTTAALQAETQQRAAVRAEKEAAEQNLETALEAVNEFYVQFAARWMASQKQPTHLQLTFLHKAAAVYRDLLQRPQETIDDKIRAGTALERLAFIERFLLQESLALQRINQSVKLGFELFDQVSTPEDHQAAMLRRLRLRAKLLAEQGYVADARQDITDAQSLAMSMEETTPQKDQFGELLLTHQFAARFWTSVGKSVEAQRAIEVADRILKEWEVPQVSAARRIAEIRQSLLIAEHALYLGDLVRSQNEAQRGIELYRKTQPLIEDEAQSHLLFCDLMVLQGEISEQKQNLDGAIASYRDAQQHLLKEILQGLTPVESSHPSQLFRQLDPDREQVYLQIQLRIARVLIKQEKCLDAEAILGQMALPAYFAIVRDFDRVRYQVTEANTWFLVGQLLKERRPLESRRAFQYANLVWLQTLERVPEATQFRSGLFHSTPDYLALRDDGLDPSTGRPSPFELKGTDPFDRIYPEDDALPLMGQARLLIETGRFRQARQFLMATLDKREEEPIEVWLYLAECCAELADTEAASQWFRQASRAMSSRSHDMRELNLLWERVAEKIDPDSR